MIAPHLLDEAVVLGLRSAWRGGPTPVVLIPSAIEADLAAELREVVTPRLKQHFVADRGRFSAAQAPAKLELIEELAGLAARIAERPLGVLDARWLLFRAGDYALFKEGAALSVAAIEATLDFSAAESLGGEVVYARGDEALVALPSAPLSLALVDRPAQAVRQTRYVPQKQGPAEIHRLRVILAQVP